MVRPFKYLKGWHMEEDKDLHSAAPKVRDGREISFMLHLEESLPNSCFLKPYVNQNTAIL